VIRSTCGAYDGYDHYILKLTANPQAGMRYFAGRARSPQALERRVEAIQKTPYAIARVNLRFNWSSTLKME
jgi:hypothetical protein